MANKKADAYLERVLELAQKDPEVKRHIPNTDLWESLRDIALPFADRIDNLLKGYGDRPALGERAYALQDKGRTGKLTRVYNSNFEAISYLDFRTLIRSIARAWTTQDKFRVNPDEFVCMMGFTGIDFAALDVACIYVQAVSVPIQANYGFETLKGMLEKIEPTVLATTVGDLDMAVRLAEVIPTLRSLIVFDYDNQDSRNKTDWDSAKDNLAVTCPHVSAISLNELDELGDPNEFTLLPPHPDGTERLSPKRL